MSNKTLKTKLKKLYPNIYIEVTDNKKFLVNEDELKQFVSKSILKYFEYEKEVFDCENYKDVLQGMLSLFNGQYAFGQVHVVKTDGTAHALNCFIDIFGNLKAIEPQNNVIFNLEDNGMYPYLIII